MADLALGIGPATVVLSSEHDGVLSELSRDFSAFVGTEAAARIRLGLVASDPPGEPAQGWPALRTRRFRAFDAGPVRTILYEGGAAARYDYSRRAGTIWCADAERLRELAYLAILSRAGEALDEAGLHRVHALGFEHRGSAGLVVLPQGGGKSVLALELLRSTPLRILSEDTPLLSRDGTVHPFPLRWGFRPDADLSDVPPELVRPFRRRVHGLKLLVDPAHYRSRLAGPAPLRWILFGARGGGPAFEPMAPAAALAGLLVHMVLGAGIAQLVEYTVRLRSAPLLASIAFRRLGAALGAVSKARALRFSLSDDPGANAAALQRLADESAER